jgi:hypothetical protein
VRIAPRRKGFLCARLIILRKGHEPVEADALCCSWLRTGLGASESVPRSHLLAICDRVLNLRKEVMDTVGAKIKAITPAKYEQFELLLADKKA